MGWRGSRGGQDGYAGRTCEMAGELGEHRRDTLTSPTRSCFAAGLDLKEGGIQKREREGEGRGRGRGRERERERDRERDRGRGRQMDERAAAGERERERGSGWVEGS